MRDDRLYLIHIGECVQRIRRYSSGGRAVFFAQEIVQDAVVRNLQVRAESTQRLSEAMKNRWPRIDWQGMAGFRNVAVHGYLGVDLERVWRIVEQDIGPLAETVHAMLESLGPTES